MSQQVIDQPYVMRDALEIPPAGTAVTGRASRRDAYPVVVTSSSGEAMDALTRLLGDAAVAVITDETVEALYGQALIGALRRGGREVVVKAIPAGEGSKSLEQATELWHWLATGPIGRRDFVVCAGGGVVCDLGGWVASAYMRGLPYVNLPTTLLAQVDGALGGKVAANHPVAKNLIGAFHQPAGVVANVGYLRSIGARHLRAGLAESIKKAVIASPGYWAFITGRAEGILDRDPVLLERLVTGAAAIKTALIERDPYEEDLRRPLNFGHTIGHPMETVSGYAPLLHGEAVAFGMVVETRIAAARGLVRGALLEELIDLLRRCGLPTCAADLPAAFDAAAIVAATGKVRQIRAGSLRFVLPMEVGVTAIADDVSDDEIRSALAECGIGRLRGSSSSD